MSDAAFGPDGADLVYAGRKNKRWRLVVNGIEKPALAYNEISPEGGPGFSPDGKYLAFKARRKTKWFLVVNGQAGPSFDRLYKFAFRVDGMEYLAERQDDVSLVHCLQPYPAASGSGTAGTIEMRLSDIPRYPVTASECVPCKEKARSLTNDNGEDDD